MFEWFKKLQKKWKCAKLKDNTFSFLCESYTGDELVVFDTETTGLDIKQDSILSIGAVKIKNNKILTSKTFEVYIKNDSLENSKSIAIHGIRPCDLKDAKDSETAIKEFLEFIGARPLVGYYLEFDVAMINKYIKPLIGISLPNKMIEVSEIYFDQTIAFIPQGNIDLRFDTILQKCGLPKMGAHNAVNDAIMTAMIYLKLTKGKSNDKRSF